MIRVKCLLKDCVYWNAPEEPPKNQKNCDCSHPEKDYYMENASCPLYKRDWQKTGHEDLAERFRRKK